MPLTVAVEFHGVPTVPITSKTIVFTSEQGNKITVRDVIEELLIIEPRLGGTIIDSDNNLLLVKGAGPGANNNLLMIKISILKWH